MGGQRLDLLCECFECVCWPLMLCFLSPTVKTFKYCNTINTELGLEYREAEYTNIAETRDFIGDLGSSVQSSLRNVWLFWKVTVKDSEYFNLFYIIFFMDVFLGAVTKH